METNNLIKTTKKPLVEEIRELCKEHRMSRDIFNIEDLSAYTGLARGYIYKLTSARVIPHYKPLNINNGYKFLRFI